MVSCRWGNTCFGKITPETGVLLAKPTLMIGLTSSDAPTVQDKWRDNTICAVTSKCAKLDTRPTLQRVAPPCRDQRVARQ